MKVNLSHYAVYKIYTAVFIVCMYICFISVNRVSDAWVSSEWGATESRVPEHTGIRGFEELHVVLQTAVGTVWLFQAIFHILQTALEPPLCLNIFYQWKKRGKKRHSSKINYLLYISTTNSNKPCLRISHQSLFNSKKNYLFLALYHFFLHRPCCISYRL